MSNVATEPKRLRSQRTSAVNLSFETGGGGKAARWKWRVKCTRYVRDLSLKMACWSAICNRDCIVFCPSPCDIQDTCVFVAGCGIVFFFYVCVCMLAMYVRCRVFGRIDVRTVSISLRRCLRRPVDCKHVFSPPLGSTQTIRLSSNSRRGGEVGGGGGRLAIEFQLNLAVPVSLV